MKHFKAIAAMSLNRVIGAGGKIPWHLPEDFKWFKKMTMGNVVVMGRKTFESLGQPLPNRKNLILTRHPQRLIKQHPEIFGQYHEWRGGQLSQARLPISFHQAGRKTGDGNFHFQLAGQAGSGGISERHFHLRRRADLRAGVAALFRPLPDAGETRGGRGDAFFPPFEDKFELAEEIRDEPEFKILHYRHKSLLK